MGIKTILKQDNKFTPFIFIFIFFIIGILSLIFSSLNDIFLIILSILFFLVCCIFNYENCLCCLLFIFSYAIIDFKQNEITLYNLLSAIFIAVASLKYFIRLLLKKEKFYRLPFIFTIILTLYGLYNLDISQIMYYFAEIVLIVSFYLTFCNAKALNINKLFFYFITGILSAAAISILYSVFADNMEIFFGLENRFQSLYRNPNTLQITSSISLSFLIYFYFKKELNTCLFFLLSFIFIILGFLTQSKAFLVCLFLLMIVYFILEFRSNKKLAFIILLGFSACFFIFVICFKEKIQDYLDRFMLSNYDNILDKILTGRYSLWKNYLDLWAKNIFTILFGYGVTCKQPLELGAHSGYVDTLYTYGLIGCSIILLLIISFITQVKYKKDRFSFLNLIPLLIFLILSLEEYLFSSCRLIFLLVTIIVFDKRKKNNNIIIEDMGD